MPANAHGNIMREKNKKTFVSQAGTYSCQPKIIYWYITHLRTCC